MPLDESYRRTPWPASPPVRIFFPSADPRFFRARGGDPLVQPPPLFRQSAGSLVERRLPGRQFGFRRGPFPVPSLDRLLPAGDLLGQRSLLDLDRRYGIFIVIESTSDVGTQIGNKVKPVVDSIFDGAKLSK